MLVWCSLYVSHFYTKTVISRTTLTSLNIAIRRETQNRAKISWDGVT